MSRNVYESRLRDQARIMVRLERLARLSAHRGDVIRASELLAEREMVAVERSRLLRMAWDERRQRAVEASPI